jgi:hypothetical protein
MHRKHSIRGKLLPSLSSLPSCFPITQRQAARALGRMLLHPLGELRRAHQAELHQTSAKSEVVTVCSWQFAGEERLQSTAIILITITEPRRCDRHWRR